VGYPASVFLTKPLAQGVAVITGIGGSFRVEWVAGFLWNGWQTSRGIRKRREEYLQRIPIEGKFGQRKNGYRLNYIRAKRADTSSAWINSIFMVMNLLILIRIFFAPGKRVAAVVLSALLHVAKSTLTICSLNMPRMGGPALIRG